MILSAIIQIALLAFLFSFRSSKPLSDSPVNTPLATLVSPQTPQRRTANASQPQTPQKNRSLPFEQKTPQNFEQIISVSKTQETVEINGNNTSEFDEVFDDFYENSQTDSPKPLYMPKIPYPKAAKTAKIEGVAEISYTIDTTGRVVSVRLLSIPHVSFEKTIEKAVLSWRFSPAIKNGKPVPINANQTIVFKLE